MDDASDPTRTAEPPRAAAYHPGVMPGATSGAPVFGGALRVGVVLADMGRLRVEALKFLTVHMNTLQPALQFEFLPAPPDDPFLALLRPGRACDRNGLAAVAGAFETRVQAHCLGRNQAYALVEPPPDALVVLSLARFTDQYYTKRHGALTVAALGGWNRHMAPPSLFEILLTLLLREGMGFRVPALRRSVHLGTKGCLCDFTDALEDVRYKVLQGFVCTHCREAMRRAGAATLADELLPVLDKRWLGTTAQPNTPASIAAKLGHDLFVTRGVTPTLWERVRASLAAEGGKQLLTVVGGVLLAFLLLRLGLKATG
jgi:hypothetical protein